MIISSPGRTEIPVGPGTRLAMLAVGGGGAGGARAGGGGGQLATRVWQSPLPGIIVVVVAIIQLLLDGF